MSALLSIAPELIHAISDQLDVCDIKSLRLTCKHLGELLACHVLRKLTIDLNKQSLNTDVRKLQSLASGFSAASQGIRELTIISVDPGYDSTSPVPPMRYVDNQWVSEPEPEQPPEVRVAQEAVKTCLFDAISSLKSIRAVRWTPVAKKLVWAQQLVVDALVTLPNLERLHIATSRCSVKIPFDSLPPLRELSLTGLGADDSYPGIREGIVKLINRSPQLSSLNVQGVYCYRQEIDDDQSLHGLLKNYPKDKAPLRLRELSMEWFLLRLDKITLPHLRHLTSLKLKHIRGPYQTAGNWDWGISEEFLNSQASQDQKIYGSSRSGVWLTLAEEGIRLQEIVTDHASTGLLAYLESYSGLERFKLEPGGFNDGSTSDAVALRFFETSIKNHTKSIEELDIIPPFEGAWCFSKNNLPIISTCTKLKDLRMCIISSHIQEADAGKSPRKNIIKLFLDTAAIQLPLLETLGVSASNSESLRGVMCGNPAMAHYGSTQRLISENVTKYKAPSTCDRLPQLMVGSRAFTPILERPRPREGVKERVKGFMNQWSRSNKAKGPGRMVYKSDSTDEDHGYYDWY